MKKICLTVVGLYLMLLHAFSQATTPPETYTSKPLTVDEVNFVSSYYNQNGNHSAVTGGIGTEKVTDVLNNIELKFVAWDASENKHTLTTGLGFDLHTAASQAFVSKTGASSPNGARFYPNINWNVENVKKGHSFGLGAYYSTEYNYQSIGLDAEYSKKTKNNGEFSGKLSGYFDNVLQLYPSELRPATTTTTVVVTTSSRGGGSSSSVTRENQIPTRPRTTISATLSFSQVINKSLQASISTDLVGQGGDLGLPFHRVYFTDNSVHVENLPNSRFKLPIGARLNYFLGDNMVLRTSYRFYVDNWGITSHTASLEVPYKITPFISVAPFYRYYTQTASTYFAPYQKHTATETYYTSNYSLSAFNSGFYGVNFKITTAKSKLNTVELRYGHYTQTTDLNSNVISLSFKFK